jgi:phenylacetic acid degradation protein paaN
MSLFEKHLNLLETAIEANQQRGFYSAFPEHPSPKVYGETADEDGKKAFESHIANDFIFPQQAGSNQWVGEEVSPFTQEKLGIRYPFFEPEFLINNAQKSFEKWASTDIETRVGLLSESLERVSKRFFEIAYATMHTTGQGYMMAFQASGPHAADRALEALALSYEELTRFPSSAMWEKPMGKFNLNLKKWWKPVPKGISLVIGCSTFPTWNSVTGIYASLAAGNPVIVKPHPMAMLPIAIVIKEIQQVFAENNIPSGVLQFSACDEVRPLTKELAEHEAVKLIDFTGSSAFGNYLENLKGKTVFTEKAGVNSVIIDSVENADEVAANLAFSISLYSGQMCTAPQNIFVPANGIKTNDGTLSFDDFAAKMVQAINGLVDNPKAGPFVLGAIQNPATLERVNNPNVSGSKVLLASKKVENPQFPHARTASPVLLEVDASNLKAISQECFGPIAFLVKTENSDQSIKLTQTLAKEHGAISFGAYTTDEALKQSIAQRMSEAFCPVSFNLTGQIFLNQHAAFSDFHVTGGNPAGNASFTSPEYVTRRFVWVGFREPV